MMKKASMQQHLSQLKAKGKLKGSGKGKSC
jgi:hypothetical protein